jgi:hypothetical protein
LRENKDRDISLDTYYRIYNREKTLLLQQQQQQQLKLLLINISLLKIEI